MSSKVFNATTFERYLADLTVGLGRLLRSAVKRPRKRAIHQARVASRRLGAALDLIRPLAGKNKSVRDLRKTCKRVRRTLGEVRDDDVLAELLSQDSLTPATRDLLVTHLAKHRRSAVEELQKTFATSKAMKLVRVRGSLLRELRPAMDWLIRERLHGELDEMLRRSDASDVAFHELRVQVKRVRYLLEIASACGLSVDERTIDSFTQVQKLLGRWHDAAIYARLCAKAAAKSSRFEATPLVADELIRVAGRRSRRSIATLREFTRLWRRQGEAVVSQIKQAVPLTRPKTDRGRAGSRETRRTATRREGDQRSGLA